ncbi:unannotated protein [freshwater metagenome]|uniref:Unannotated protein n=1 Tax=freshwater metagenome TaxID=449393 RepID=A0A6J6RRH8_9ZZZZ
MASASACSRDKPTDPAAEFASDSTRRCSSTSCCRCVSTADWAVTATCTAAAAACIWERSAADSRLPSRSAARRPVRAMAAPAAALAARCFSSTSSNSSRRRLMSATDGSTAAHAGGTSASALSEARASCWRRNAPTPAITRAISACSACIAASCFPISETRPASTAMRCCSATTCSGLFSASRMRATSAFSSWLRLLRNTSSSLSLPMSQSTWARGSSVEVDPPLANLENSAEKSFSVPEELRSTP